MPEISVIVPVYNAAKYLEECIESVLAQTFRNFELILVDNGSTDSSPAICRMYAEEHPGVVRHLSVDPVGVSEARNIGTSSSRGEYIFYLDADDMLLRHALERMYTIMTTSPKCDIAIAQFTQEPNYNNSGEHLPKLISPEDALISTLYQEWPHHPSAWAKLYRRTLLGSPFVKGRRYEDLQAFAPIYLRARSIAVTDEVIYYYRPNSESFINTWSESRADALWAVDSLRAFVAEACREASHAALARSFSAYFNIFLLSSRHGKTELADRCWKFVREHRLAMLTDSRVRLKNKAGALLSLCGRKVCLGLSELFMK
ncbi:MAG: glycosyltransferase family 2 protein [Muribaculaceae bacterium]|nr:glycosyltransferase family 2 protein [Muribaculaceae bacterium]